MYNHITVVGHLGRDPEMSYTPSGTAVTKFSVASSRKWTDGNGERKEQTTWFRVVAWQKLAETCSNYLHKGSKVLITGRMESRKYTDKDNVDRETWELIADGMTMLDSAPQRQDGTGQREADLNADIPF